MHIGSLLGATVWCGQLVTYIALMILLGMLRCLHENLTCL
ncbi:hypothetical protein M23134_04786 [Microscilla marina ATCC 23134]|uniref:Uncharacterized protein n=1 Tax=Microscilla marina ATCC 23134 TaxID=313606 RepID=A1ZRU8_MICM2|nr:hypothetical protein M23134_04786 [Microscilla marina ATCC 23134]